MGIDTDWNCAISLRPLEDSTKPDPHRMTSDYADWDVKVPRLSLLPDVDRSQRSYILGVDAPGCPCPALSPCLASFVKFVSLPAVVWWQARLPHGIAAIREHIENVDNVPLLVSLFTDATPQTTQDMIGIYHEYHEAVLAVGMSHR